MTCHKKPMCADMYECASCRTNGHKQWCGILCAEDGCGKCTCGAWDLHDIAKRRGFLWNTPTTSSGRFDEAKRSGDVFSGSRREDRGSFWDAFDSLHRSLLVLLGIASTGLVLHAFGVFCR